MVQAARFCGLLEASAAAHDRARQLDPNILASVDHTYWQLGDDDRVLEYTVRPYDGQIILTNRLLHALVVGEQGRTAEAVQQLREIEQGTLTAYSRAMVFSFRALFEGRREESLESAERVFEQAPDPEAVYWHARVFGYFGERARAVAALGAAADHGFVLYRTLTRRDAWLDAVRSSPEFGELLVRAKSRYREADAAFRNAGGEELLRVNSVLLDHGGNHE